MDKSNCTEVANIIKKNDVDTKQNSISNRVTSN